VSRLDPGVAGLAGAGYLFVVMPDKMLHKLTVDRPSYN
jgi:hypothetical protein